MPYTVANQLNNIWRYRELGVELFWTYLKLRHVGSVLGFVWTLLNPLLYILTYWIVFSLIIRMGLDNYPLFLIPGYLAWTFTFNAIVNSSESILQSKDLITKIAFPNEIIVLTNVAIGLVDFLISLVILVLIVIIFYPPTSLLFFLVPYFLILQVMLTIGLCLIAACVSVFYKDVPKLIIILGQIFFFLTPIFYPLSFIPSDYQFIVLINPVAQIISIYHSLIYYKELPDLFLVFIPTSISFLTLLVGFLIFNKLKHSFAELS